MVLDANDMRTNQTSGRPHEQHLSSVLRLEFLHTYSEHSRLYRITMQVLESPDLRIHAYCRDPWNRVRNTGRVILLIALFCNTIDEIATCRVN